MGIVINTAVDDIRLYYKHTGVAGSPQTSWFIKNLSTSKAIKVTIYFWEGHPDLGMNDTDSWSLEPGEFKSIRIRSSQGPTFWNAKKVGARYLGC
ncbi:hypothetical protein [Polaribacter sp. Hel1_85]|uniref:hypothetical protein n=1 Tax=Polaribacter sp. Hel1_85 TaxID=1250005 RepID=UPI00052C18E8|nr:hypothetical protein [Polaribacter sp. Hel1_85]KGL63449.1 hypothetical protein PHEL85_0485 [Polaribacter sp. Hel1_85]